MYITVGELLLLAVCFSQQPIVYNRIARYMVPLRALLSMLMMSLALFHYADNTNKMASLLYHSTTAALAVDILRHGSICPLLLGRHLLDQFALDELGSLHLLKCAIGVLAAIEIVLGKRRKRHQNGGGILEQYPIYSWILDLQLLLFLVRVLRHQDVIHVAILLLHLGHYFGAWKKVRKFLLTEDAPRRAVPKLHHAE